MVRSAHGDHKVSPELADRLEFLSDAWTNAPTLSSLCCPACGGDDIAAVWEAVIPQPIVPAPDGYDWEEWEIDAITFGRELFSCCDCRFTAWEHEAFVPGCCRESDAEAAAHPVSESARALGRDCGELRRELLTHGPSARQRKIAFGYGRETSAARIADNVAALELAEGDALRLGDLVGAPRGPVHAWVENFADTLSEFIDGAPALVEVLGGLSLLEAAWWDAARPPRS